ncbi:MAG TPA: hypothetical protein PLH23_10680, partial [Hyphomonadaceae bacterium]|nr:hypothetical protein [Hyphomonadaceae bacterium]
DDGKLPLGVRVGTARKDGANWRIDLAMESAPVDFVRLVPPPDFASPETAPALGGVERNTDESLKTVSAPLAATTTSTTTPATPALRPQTGTTRPAATQPAQPAQTQPAQPAQPGGQGGGQ